MSLAQPYSYWQGNFNVMTSNSQWPAPDPYQLVIPAARRFDDSYVRSLWSAQLSYQSPGTNTAYGWWGQAQVRLVVAEDPQALATVSDISDDDPLTLGWKPLTPRWQPMVTGGNNYQVVWTTGHEPLILRTRRDFVDAGHFPQICAGLFAFDQNGLFALTETGGKILRAQITGRVLWQSSQAP